MNIQRMVKRMLEKLSRASNVQLAVLLIIVLSVVFTSLITWELVVHRGEAGELADITSVLISEYEAWGILISSLVRLLFLLPFWIGWALIPQKKTGLTYLHKLLFAIAFGFTLAFFVTSFLDLVHDVLVFGFGSSFLKIFFKSTEVKTAVYFLLGTVTVLWVFIIRPPPKKNQ